MKSKALILVFLGLMQGIFAQNTGNSEDLGSSTTPSQIDFTSNPPPPPNLKNLPTFHKILI